MGEVFHRRTNGKHAWGNIGVAYDSPLLTPDERTKVNDGMRRVEADAAAVRYMRRYYEPTGRTRSKVITVHAHDDGLVLVENETKYRQAFEAAKNADRLVQLYTSYGGHCGFITEIFPAVDALVAWVERDQKPTPASIQAACPGCRFTDQQPGPWGLKVVERSQRGAPTASLVCSDLPNDCPPRARAARSTAAARAVSARSTSRVACWDRPANRRLKGCALQLSYDRKRKDAALQRAHAQGKRDGALGARTPLTEQHDRKHRGQQIDRDSRSTQ